MNRLDPNRSVLQVLLTVFAMLVFVFLIAPLAVIVPISFSSGQYLEFPPPGYSFQWYQRYFGDFLWREATLQSLKIASSATAIAILLGVPFSIAASRSKNRWLGVTETLVYMPIIIPVIVYSIGAYFVFSSIGLVGNWYGIAVANAALILPFVIIVTTAGLRRFDINTEVAARGLGASHLQAMWHVTLPQVAPSVLSGALLAFVMAFDELVVAVFLAGSIPPLPLKMYENITMQIDPTVAAVSVIEILLVVAIFLGISWRGGGLRNVVGK